MTADTMMLLKKSMRPLWTKWRRLVVVAVIAWILVIMLMRNTLSSDSAVGWTDHLPGFGSAHQQRLDYPDSARRLWGELHPLLEEAAPGVDNPQTEQDVGSQWWKPNQEYDLMDITKMKHGDILKMARAHDRFVNQAKIRFPRYIPTKGGAKRGIVTCAGGDFLPIFLVSLRMLRRTGSTLPVELFFADDDEYEPDLCEEVLPMLGVRCMVLSDIFDHSNTTQQSQEIKRFQYKIFAILFSTFDEVLFLDSDTIPLHDPDAIFTSDVFKDHGMITWPDLWATSVSPAYYLMADQDPPPIVLRASTESGQFLISKKTHHQTLLVAAYYNYYGPSHYYLLLCQGGFGRGDKSTFVPAAIAAGQPFYDVSEPTKQIGRWQEGSITVYALVQFDPMQDRNLTSQGKWRARNSSVADPIRPFFLHTNNPKWNPLKITDIGGSNPATQLSGRPSWAFIDPPESMALIPGVERRLWEEVRWVGCELENKIKTWKEKQAICSKIKDHFANFLDNSPPPIEEFQHRESSDDEAGSGVSAQQPGQIDTPEITNDMTGSPPATFEGSDDTRQPEDKDQTTNDLLGSPAGDSNSGLPESQYAFATLLGGFMSPDMPDRYAHIPLDGGGLEEADGYYIGARYLNYILRHNPATKSSSPIPVVVLVTEDVKDYKIARLEREGATVIRADKILPPSWINMVDKRYEDMFTKLRLWQLIQFEKVCYIDADILITAPLEGIFHDPATEARAPLRNSTKSSSTFLPDSYVFAAGSEKFAWDHPIPPLNTGSYMNMGFFVMSPNEPQYQYYLSKINDSQEQDWEGGGFAEQDLLNDVHGEQGPMPWQHLDWKWNTNFPTKKDLDVGVHSLHEKFWEKGSGDPALKEIWTKQVQEMEAFYAARGTNDRKVDD